MNDLDNIDQMLRDFIFPPISNCTINESGDLVACVLKKIVSTKSNIYILKPKEG